MPRLDLSFNASPLVVAGSSIALAAASSISAGSSLRSATALIVALALMWRLDQLRPVPPLPAAMWLLALGYLSVFFGVLDGSLSWVNSAADKASIFGQLIAVQLVLGVLPLTVAAVTGQISITWLGLTARPALLGTAFSLGGLILSLVIDLVLMGRSAVSTQSIEIAEVLSALVVMIAIGITYRLVQGLRTEAITAARVRRLDRGWVHYVRNLYRHSPGRISTRNDPFDSIERILLHSARNADSQVFQDALNQASRRLQEIASNPVQQGDDEYSGPELATEIAFDEYLARQLAPLIQEVARQKVRWALDALLDFRWGLERSGIRWRQEPEGSRTGSQLVVPTIIRGDRVGAPSGVRFYAAIADASLEEGLDREASSAIVRASRYINRVFVRLPSPEGIFELDQTARRGASAQAADAQGVVDGIGGYLHTLRRWSEVTVRGRLTESLRFLSWAVEDLLSGAGKIEEPCWADWFARQAAFAAYDIALLAANSRLLAYQVPHFHFQGNFRMSREADVRLTRRLMEWVPITLKKIAGVADYLTVVDTTMLALLCFPECIELAAALAAALSFIGDEAAKVPADPERALLLIEVSARLEQIRRGAGAAREEFEKAFDKHRAEMTKGREPAK